MPAKIGDKPMSATVLIRMSGELKVDLKKLSAENRRKLAEYCRLVLEDHVKTKKRK
jgi:predicted DNA-binding protein